MSRPRPQSTLENRQPPPSGPRPGSRDPWGRRAPAARSPAPARLQLGRLATPLGTLLLVSDTHGALRALDFSDCEARMRRLLRTHYGRQPLSLGAAPAALTHSLRGYFEGKLEALRDIAWSSSGTPLQQAVWHALTEIPAGETRSYGELARGLGLPEGARAVGWANAANPVAIVVPCHRVIGATGKLTGYAGGLARKHWLLAHEGARFAEGASGDLFGALSPALTAVARG